MRFVNIAVGTNDSSDMNRAVEGLSEEYGLEYRSYDSSSLDSDPILMSEMIDFVSGADLVAIRVHGDTSYFKRFGKLKEVVESNRVSTLLVCTEEEVTSENRHLFLGTDEEYTLLLTYYELGGNGNYRSMLMWCIRRFDNRDLEVPEPQRLPMQGVLLPQGGWAPIEDIARGIDPSDLNIGVFFYQGQWVSDDMAGIRGLIDAIRDAGGNPVPVFLQTYENPVTGSKGVKRILSEDLTVDGHPVLDVIVETMSFSQVLVANPGDGSSALHDNFFRSYGVPVIQTMSLNVSEDQWAGDLAGLSPSGIIYDIVNPEFDGQIISVPTSSTFKAPDGVILHISMDDRARRVAEQAVMWARLRHTDKGSRKVAIILYMYPPKLANAGSASGLDTFQSVVDLLHRMGDEGYYLGEEVPKTSRELSDLLLSGLTNDTEWLSEEGILARAADTVDGGLYREWYDHVPEGIRSDMGRGWGDPPGNLGIAEGRIAIPGTIFGNVFVGFQPDRGRDVQQDYHDMGCVMPHSYLAFYRWLKHVFHVDAIVHMGTHGTLEWLPGKAVALSGECCPDMILDSLPNIYPYIIGNPGEGIQAKRRSAAVIVDHMVPTMVRAGGYDEIDDLEAVLQNLMAVSAQGQGDKADIIRSDLRRTLAKLEMFADVELSPDCTDGELDKAVDRIYDYITDVKESLIKDGLHILGRPPEGRRLIESIYALTRLDNGNVPSLRGSVALATGHDIATLISDPSDIDPDTGSPNGVILSKVEDGTEKLISMMAENGFDRSRCLELILSLYPNDNERLVESVSFVCDRLYPDLMGISGEIDSIIDALSGSFILPGPSGAPTRGRAQILPTGRNFYSIDPETVPWQSSWEVGKGLAEQMLERYVSEHGTHPRNVAMVVWATDTMKTGGEDISYILWLMGLHPIWSGYGGRVEGLAVVPLSELGRPRVDVTVRISGLFRDTFPNIVNLLDRGVAMIAELDESDEDNALRANLRDDVVRAIERGIPEDRAREEAKVRIFGDAPGTYGSGTSTLISTSRWGDLSDLGGIYLSCGSYAYGVGRRGKSLPSAFSRRLSITDVTVKNSISREYDMLDNDDVYNDLGGMNAAIRYLRGESPMSVIGCSEDTTDLRTRTIGEEARFIFRSKIQNPKWVNGLREHGFNGAQEISNLTEYVFAWDATSGIVDPWMYQTIADRFLLDGVNSEWMRDVNPYAMHETVSWLLEAVGRGMWSPDDETRERLEALYLDLEGDLEGTE